MTDLVFVDTETTGLEPDDHIWEFAAIRINTLGAEHTTLIQIDHDATRVKQLPEKFQTDHTERFGSTNALVLSRADAAHVIAYALTDAHLVGVNPSFDARMIEHHLREFGLTPTWHYHLIDLAAMTLGHLAARGETIEIPWRSDDLAARVGAPTVDGNGEPLYGRHTALGDARWCLDWWDALA